MKIVCTKCDHENDLGRVFCTSCGARLDLSKATMDTMQKSREVRQTWRFGRAILLVLVVAVLAALGLAAWPNAPVAAAGKAASAERVRDRLRAMQDALAAGQASGTSFEEKELNGYLMATAKDSGFESLTVKLSEGSFRLRAVGKAGPFGLGPLSVGPISVSWDLAGAPVQASLNIRSAKLGHLPLPGPLAGPAIRRFRTAFQARKDKDLLGKVSEIKVTEGKVALTVRK